MPGSEWRLERDANLNPRIVLSILGKYDHSHKLLQSVASVGPQRPRGLPGTAAGVRAVARSDNDETAAERVVR